MTQKEKRNGMTSEKLTKEQLKDSWKKREKSSVSVAASLAKAFQLLGSGEGSMTPEELSSLKSCVSQISSSHAIYSLKTSKDYSTTTAEIPLRQSSERWMNMGMMSNGNALTLKTLEHPKIDKECLLSQVLEDMGGGKQGSIRRNILPIRRTDETGNLEGIKTVATYTYPSFRVGQQIVGVEGIFPTLTTKHHVGDTAKIAVVENGKKRVRKLTPLEYWRLQGFPDDKFWLAEATGLSHHQLYKQAGNSVTVNVIEEIASRL